MPTCKAFGCKNSTGKLKERKSFFMIPRPKNVEEKLRCLRWLHNISRADVNINNTNFGKDCVLCEDHFHPDCMKREVIDSEELGKRRKKELVSGAVPTIFEHKTYEEINMDGTKVLQRSSSIKRTKAVDRLQVSQCYIIISICLFFYWAPELSVV